MVLFLFFGSINQKLKLGIENAKIKHDPSPSQISLILCLVQSFGLKQSLVADYIGLRKSFFLKATLLRRIKNEVIYFILMNFSH